MIRVVFVCTGNICRSPSAEGVFRQKLVTTGHADAIAVDSCAMMGWHRGRQPDARAQAAALRRGYDLSDLRARQISVADFSTFDYLFAMDHSHFDAMQQIAPPGAAARIYMFLEPVQQQFQQLDIPDPYYGGAEGFEQVLDMIESASDAWIARLVD